MAGERPTHNVKLYDPNREDDKGKYVGVGWERKDGSIAIVLDPGIILTTVGARVVIYKRKADGERKRGERGERDERPGRRYD